MSTCFCLSLAMLILRNVLDWPRLALEYLRTDISVIFINPALSYITPPAQASIPETGWSHILVSINDKDVWQLSVEVKPILGGNRCTVTNKIAVDVERLKMDCGWCRRAYELCGEDAARAKLREDSGEVAAEAVWQQRWRI